MPYSGFQCKFPRKGSPIVLNKVYCVSPCSGYDILLKDNQPIYPEKRCEPTTCSII